MKQSKDYSGEIKCSNEVLSYRAEAASWTVNISDIRLIGEYTNSDGPYLDDYFFVFLTSFENGWHEASFYARGRDEMLDTLSMMLGSSIDTGLCDSTSYKSRIIWPSKWKNQEMMEVLPLKKIGFWRRIFDSGSRELVPSKAMREVFSE